MSEEAKPTPEKEKPKKRKTFSSAAGDKVRAEHRRSGVIKTLIAGALGGAAYGVHRGAEKFLPTDTRRAIDDTARTFDKLRMSKALAGGKLDDNRVIEAYAQHASRLADAPVAGMKGREFVKFLRTKLPVDNKWHDFYSDAHYDAFGRGPAYGAAQVIDEQAENITKRPGAAAKLKKYLADKWPSKYSQKLNDSAAAHGASPMDVGPSLRESLAYNGQTMDRDKQVKVMKDIIYGDRFNKDRWPIIGGFSDRYKEVKKDLAGGLMSHSFPSYVGLGHKAKGVHSALDSTIPAILGAAGIGVGGFGLYKLIKSMQRTAYEKRMMAKAEREGHDTDETEKSAWDRSGDVLKEITNGRPYPVSYATGEGKELLEEIGKLSPSGIREEGSDLLYALNMLGHQATGLNLPMIGGQYALGKFRKRNSVWKNIMENSGVDFNVDYLKGGSNFHKPHKIQAAFALAGKQLSDDEAAQLSQQAVEMEKEAVIKQEGDEWILYTKDGERVLGRHKTKKQALLQEYAIQKSQEKQAAAWSTLTNLYNQIRPAARIIRAPKTIRKFDKNLHEILTTTAEMMRGDEKANPLSPFKDLFDQEQSMQGFDHTAKQASTLSRLRHARNLTHTHPTEGQASAGNYRKGTFKWNGLNIKIENPEGSTRRGVSKSGKAWSTVLKCDYGYFAGNGGAAPKGKDGDAIDVFIGPDPDSDVVAVVHQVIDGKFDEHKVIIGIKDKDEARSLYLSNYQKGWTCGPIHMTNVNDLKQWLASGETHKRFQKAAGLGDWLRGDKEGLDWRWGMVGGSLVRVPVMAGAVGYAKGVVPRVAGASANLAERNIYRKLLEQAQKHNVLVSKGPASQYNPMTSTISMAKGFNAPGVLAHELGHVRGGKGLLAANIVGKNGVGFGALASLLSKDEKNSKRNAWIGTALGGGMLASEIDASRRGYNAIRALGGGRRSALKAFVGLPTYAAFAGIPLMSHAVKKRMGGFDTEKRAAEADEPSAIGKGLGTLFSDFVPFAPSGARRAGAASLMAERLGQDPGLLLKYPMLSQILATAGGGALAGLAAEHTQKPVTTLLAAVAPYLATQGLKRHKINKIDREYKDTKKRKRLREVGAEGMVDDAMGSHRLGMAQAFEAMRTRKLRDIGSIAEAGDALPVATTMVGLGPAASLPLTQLIDHLEAGRFREKKADWSDQINAPAIPLYLAAAAAGVGGLVASGKKLHNDLNDPRLKSMPRHEWDGLLKHVSGRDLLSAQVGGLNNAFFARATNDEDARGMVGLALNDPRVARRLLLNPSGSKLIKQVKDHGLTAFDPTFGKASIVGHEAGHAKIEHTPGIMQALQRKLYHYSPVIAPFSAVGGMAAGLASKSPLGGLLAGTGIGLLGGAGMMFPEYMATHHGMKGLESYQGGKWKQDGDWKRQLTALGTYGSLNVLPASVAGLLGGIVGKRRAKKKQREAEREVREAGEEPDNVTRMDENARNVEKAASLLQRFQRLQEIKLQAKALGANRADMTAVKEFGSYLKPSINQFYNHKDVVAAGIKKGMKGSKILEILKNMQPPPGA